MPVELRPRARTLVIVNPASAAGRALRAAPLIAEYLRKKDWPAEFVESASADDIRRHAAEAVDAGYAYAVALGGDGTFHHVLNGALARADGALVAHPASLGFFPAGHGNDIAAALGIPQDPIAAAAQFLRTPPRAVDIFRARFPDGRIELCIGAGGLGLDAEAARLANGRFRRLPGAARYVAGALWSLAGFRPLEIDLRADGERWRGQALFVAVSNAPGYGAGVKIAPAARMDDGLLDLTIVAPLAWTRLLEAIPIVLRTGDLRWPEIHRLRAQKVQLCTDRPASFQGDGELLGDAPVEIEILAGGALVVSPKTLED